MRSSRLAVSAAALLLLVPAPADAARDRDRDRGARVSVGLGADYIVDPEVGAFQLNFALETPITRGLTAGVRAGALVADADGGDETKVGAPLDFRLRVRTHGLYFDGLVGPWFIFDTSDTLRFHGALGFGVLGNGVSFGLEVGALARSGIIGLRLAFSL